MQTLNAAGKRDFGNNTFDRYGGRFCFLSKRAVNSKNSLLFESLEEFCIIIRVVDNNGPIRHVEVISILFQPLSLKTSISNIFFLFVIISKYL